MRPARARRRRPGPRNLPHAGGRRIVQLAGRRTAELRDHHTLTYSFDEEHHNHIHVDNGVSGYGPPSFSERSGAQTQLVQGVLRWVFGRDVPDDGEFDGATRDAVRSIQTERGITAHLSTTAGWSAFLDAAVAP